MSDIIQNHINSILKDGARPTKYRCEIFLPTTFSAEEKNLDIICKSAVFPTKINEVIMVKYRGRNIPIPGQEKFTQTLDLTFYLDAKHSYKLLFEEWAQALNYDAYQGQLSGAASYLQDEQNFNLSAAKTSIILTQLNFDGDIDEMAYHFYGVFPKEISQVVLGAETVSAMSEFTVSFAFSYFKAVKKKDGVDSDSVANSILQSVQGDMNKVVNKAMGYLSNSRMGKKLNADARNAASVIQNRGKSIGTSFSEFLG